MNSITEKELQMSDLKEFLDAVVQMREAQKLEWAALPVNFKLWKRARQKQAVSKLEDKVDILAKALQRTYGRTQGDKAENASSVEAHAGEEPAELKKVRRRIDNSARGS